ncbi:hypothetical protein A0J61_09468 [Choanephora cucurbitarum]|uniref:PARP-type domain-containing protein n=1 Tax=Choanephora cucurbitarum TaxID=101091 RepID=A0A1C7N0D2_9FUNG|nr:hypothetical protein A0J61_09468 [Choanephora cucurbitarum]
MINYTIDYAKDELKCIGSRDICPAKDKNIGEGELCLGILGSNSGQIRWYHWTCTTDKIIRDFKSKYDKPEDMEGYSELEEEDKERIMRAWRQGGILDIEKPEPYLIKQEKNEDQVVLESKARRTSIQQNKEHGGFKKKKDTYVSPKKAATVHSTSVPKKTMNRTANNIVHNRTMRPHAYVKSSESRTAKSSYVQVPPHKSVKTSPKRVLNVRSSGPEYNLPSTANKAEERQSKKSQGR